MSAIDDRIDDLYKLPLSEFTSARNALVKTLKASGSGDDAARVKALSKPTVVPWAINQLYWHAPKTYERLLDRGAKLRKAQIAALSGKNAALREATDAHRAAVAEAVREATRLAGAHVHADELTRTLEALSLAKEPPDHPGRLTEALQPAGFEALTGVKPAGFPVRSVRLKPDTTPSLKEIAKREAAEKKHRDQIAAAEEALERARDGVAFAKQTLERATRVYDEAEARLKRARDGS